MHTPKRLGNVAVPADGLERREDLGQLLGAKLFPLGRGVIRPHQSGWMIKVQESLEGLVAINAALPFVPLRRDIPQQAIIRICFDLLQALLPAVLAFGPSRATVQTQRGRAEKRGQGCFPRSDINRFCVVGFRTGDEPLAAKSEIRAGGWNRPDKKDARYYDNDRDSEKG